MTLSTARMLRAARNALLTVGAALGVLVMLGVVAGAVLDLRAVVITSGSMEPDIPTGSLVVARSMPADQAEIGDVVTVGTSGGARVTHRVVEVVPASQGGPGLRLQGDANPTPDAELYRADRVGVAVADVPWLGFVLSGVRTTVGTFVLGGIAMLLVLFVVTGGRRGERRLESVAVAAVVATAVAAPAVPVTTSSAAWTDQVDVSGTAFAAYDVPKPVIQSCTVSGGALAQKTARIVWAEVSTPYPVVYTATILQTGQSMLVVDDGSTRHTDFSAGLLSTILNATYTVRITASLPAPGTTWTDQSNQPVTIGLLGVNLSCGTPS